MSIQLVVCTTRAFFENCLVADADKRERAICAFKTFLEQTPEFSRVDITANNRYGSFDLFIRGEDLLREVLLSKSEGLAKALSQSVYIPTKCREHLSRQFIYTATDVALELDVCDMNWLEEAISLVEVTIREESVSVKRDFLADAVDIYGKAMAMAHTAQCPIFVSF